MNLPQTGFELAPLSHVLLPKLRYHHKLVLSILIVMGIVALLLIASLDLETLQIDSLHGAEDPLFPSYVAALLGAQATGGNRYDVLSNGDQIFPSMLAAIQNARRRVSFETYIYEKGVVGAEFTDALEAAAKRHVKVNLVVDAIGSKWIPKEWTERLENAGVVIGIFGTPKWYAPRALNNRTHRKILIVDGRVGFTGGRSGGPLARARRRQGPLARHDGAHRRARGAVDGRGVRREPHRDAQAGDADRRSSSGHSAESARQRHGAPKLADGRQQRSEATLSPVNRGRPAHAGYLLAVLHPRRIQQLGPVPRR